MAPKESSVDSNKKIFYVTAELGRTYCGKYKCLCCPYTSWKSYPVIVHITDVHPQYVHEPDPSKEKNILKEQKCSRPRINTCTEKEIVCPKKRSNSRSPLNQEAHNFDGANVVDIKKRRIMEESTSKTTGTSDVMPLSYDSDSDEEIMDDRGSCGGNEVKSVDSNDNHVADDHNNINENFEDVNFVERISDLSRHCSENSAHILSPDGQSSSSLISEDQYSKGKNTTLTALNGMHIQRNIQKRPDECDVVSEHCLTDDNWPIDLNDTDVITIDSDDEMAEAGKNKENQDHLSMDKDALLRKFQDANLRLVVTVECLNEKHENEIFKLNEKHENEIAKLKEKHENEVAKLKGELNKRSEICMVPLDHIKGELEDSNTNSYPPSGQGDRGVRALLRQLEVERNKVENFEKVITTKEKEVEAKTREILAQLESERLTAKRLENSLKEKEVQLKMRELDKKNHKTKLADELSELRRELESEKEKVASMKNRISSKRTKCTTLKSKTVEMEANFKQREEELTKKLAYVEYKLDRSRKMIKLREKLQHKEELEDERMRRIQLKTEQIVEESKSAAKKLREEMLRELERLQVEVFK